MSARLSVSIVLYGTDEPVLRKLIQSLALEKLECRIVLVDNSPTTCDYSVVREHRNIEYVYSGRNLGYGAGHNAAVRQVDPSQFTYHLVVNPDVHWDARVLGTLLSFMERNRDVALTTPKILYPDGRTQYVCKLLPTPFDLLIRRLLPPCGLRDRLQRNFELRFTGYSRSMNVPYLSGCFMLLRRSMFDQVGGFDERFFLYPEDIDLTRRLHARWRTMFCPSVCVIHEHARASYKSPRMLWIHAWNICKYFGKWGWLWDSERRQVNRETLAALRKMQAQSPVATRE